MSGMSEILQLTSQYAFSPFDGLQSVEISARKRFCSRQLNVILSSNAVLKGNVGWHILTSDILTHHNIMYYILRIPEFVYLNFLVHILAEKYLLQAQYSLFCA